MARNIGATDPIRWGICATGNIARKFVEAMALVDDAEVVAIGSRTQAAADAFATEHNIARRHPSYEALAADDEVDVIYVSTPQSRHCDDVLTFLDAGRHVLCEKPFARNLFEAQQMVDAASRGGLFLMEALWSRFLPSYLALQDELAAGVIGEPRLLEADFGFRLPEIDPDHRLFSAELAGGGLLDLGIYPVQLAHLLFGPPADVRGLAEIGPTGVDTQTAMILRHDGGALAVLHAAIRTSTFCTATIHGTEGRINIDPHMHVPQGFEVDPHGDGEKRRVEAPMEGNGYQYQVHEVHRCLRSGALESEVMAHAETIALMRTLDRIRADIGLTFPGERHADERGWGNTSDSGSGPAT